VRNPEGNQTPLVLFDQISQPQFGLYEPAGYYNREWGTMEFEAIEKAKKQAKRGDLTNEKEVRLNESHPTVRAWNLTVNEIRREGAIFNVFKGAMFGGLEVPIALVLCPAYEARSAGIHSG